MGDAADSKSAGCKSMRVQVPPSAVEIWVVFKKRLDFLSNGVSFLFLKCNLTDV